ncbi:nucleolar protein 10-like [Lingula anatina]|uniref:Nucleolar protein 10-like n=1 Tax=Lingula anatina TaxID=7574 RepID=A0A1S3I4H4_LINAN|nr:nucleolar protein 10-like [Lingula anatina]|eukprot:XP_013393123.1 nucleolar protein 10-like [Lingula anatina]
MFSNPDFQVDPESEEYRLLNPVVSKLEKDRRKRQEKQERLAQQFEEINDELEGRPSSEDSSSDDEHTWTKELKKQHKQLSEEARAKKKREREERELKPKFYEIKEGEEFHSFKRKKKTLSKKSLAERVADEDSSGIVRHVGSSLGAREMVFSLKKNEKEKHKRREAIEHHAERRKLRRSAGDIAGKQKPKSKFWMGKKVS